MLLRVAFHKTGRLAFTLRFIYRFLSSSYKKISFELESKKERVDFNVEVTGENGEKRGEKNLF